MEGQRPTIKDITPAPYLPVAEIEPRHDDPIVIPAGTWVGIVGGANTGADMGDWDTGSIATIKRYLVPAASAYYHVEYTANDLSTTFGTNGNVKDLDVWTPSARTGAAVTTTGVTTKYIGESGYGVRPVGIAFVDMYASWLGDVYVNYDRQPSVSLLTRDYVVQLPAVTTQERAIEPGDQVMVDGYGVVDLSWSPATVSQTMRVGHLVRVTAVATGLSNMTGDATQGQFVGRMSEYIVGRCLRKVKVANYSSASAGTTLAANVGSLSRSNVSTEFADAGRVQTVPGLSLQGSGLKGVPAWARNATADADGDFWVLEIHVGVC